MQKRKRRRSDRAARPAMRSPVAVGRARRSSKRFWKAIARELSSEDAAVSCGVSPPVGGRWFREGGGMPPISLAPRSARYLSFAEREEIAILRAQGAGVRDIALPDSTGRCNGFSEYIRRRPNSRVSCGAAC